MATTSHGCSNVSPPTDGPSDLHALEVYHRALEDERLKVRAFERELPFCLQLLDDAIQASKEQLEDRLTCKLNTPLHYLIHNQPSRLVCSYTGSMPPAPALGFKRTSLHALEDRYNHPPCNIDHQWRLLNTAHDSSNEVLDQDTSEIMQECIKLQDYCPVQDPRTKQEPSKKSSFLLQSDAYKISASTICDADVPRPLQNIGRKHDNTSCCNKLMNIKIENCDIFAKPRAIMDLAIERQQIKAALVYPDKLRSTSSYFSLGETRVAPNPTLAPLPTVPSAAAEAAHEQDLNTDLHVHSHGNIIGGGNGGLHGRKPRRCWSPELHQRFLRALHQLGGCQVATPKQIRELMNVDGLTNDEVKSHLQKFRLHMRRPMRTSGTSDTVGGQHHLQGSSPGHHLLVFGHIWVPPTECNGLPQSSTDDSNHLSLSHSLLSSHTNSFNICLNDRAADACPASSARPAFPDDDQDRLRQNNDHCDDIQKDPPEKYGGQYSSELQQEKALRCKLTVSNQDGHGSEPDKDVASSGIQPAQIEENQGNVHDKSTNSRKLERDDVHDSTVY